jgi:hypothetical protein
VPYFLSAGCGDRGPSLTKAGALFAQLNTKQLVPASGMESTSRHLGVAFRSTPIHCEMRGAKHIPGLFKCKYPKVPNGLRHSLMTQAVFLFSFKVPNQLRLCATEASQTNCKLTGCRYQDRAHRFTKPESKQNGLHPRQRAQAVPLFQSGRAEIDLFTLRFPDTARNCQD